MGAKALPLDGCPRSSRKIEPTMFETLITRKSLPLIYLLDNALLGPTLQSKATC